MVDEERKEAIKELKYLFYTMPIKPPMECDDKDLISRPDAMYYVKVPENLVVIDFDLKDKDCKSSSGIHLYFR